MGENKREKRNGVGRVYAGDYFLIQFLFPKRLYFH